MVEERLQAGKDTVIARHRAGKRPLRSPRHGGPAPRAWRRATGRRKKTGSNARHARPTRAGSPDRPRPGPEKLRQGSELSATSSRQSGHDRMVAAELARKPRDRDSRPPGHARRARSDPGATRCRSRQRGAEAAVKTAPVAGVTSSAAFLVDRDEQGVAITVIGGGPDPLAIARGLALAPVLLSAPAPEPGAACRKGPAQAPRRPSSRASGRHAWRRSCTIAATSPLSSKRTFAICSSVKPTGEAFTSKALSRPRAVPRRRPGCRAREGSRSPRPEPPPRSTPRG